jgi:predicted enzyme related to lactoylglutathione lyase
VIKLGKVIEIIVYVKDMDSQVCFYRDVLELNLINPQKLENYADQIWVTFNVGSCVLALHGGAQGNLGKDAPKFVFKTEDVGRIRQVLIERGIPMGVIRSPAPGVSVSDGQDPEGNKFSIESQ